jgi:peroxiredoxin
MSAMTRATGIRIAGIRIAGALLALAAISIGLPAASTARGAETETPVLHIGPFELEDLAGERVTRASWQGAKAVVLFFIGTECPVSNSYAPAMQRLSQQYAARGVSCYGVHCDPTVASKSVAEHAEEYRLTFPMVCDPRQVLAGACRVEVVPTVVVAAEDGRVWYRGRIDNRFALDGKRRDEATRHELIDALEAVLEGRTPSVGETRAFGCPLPRPKPASSGD